MASNNRLYNLSSVKNVGDSLQSTSGSLTDLADCERGKPSSSCIIPGDDISNIEDELKISSNPSGAVRRIKRQGSIEKPKLAFTKDTDDSDSASGVEQHETDEDTDIQNQKEDDTASVDVVSNQVNNMNISSGGAPASEIVLAESTSHTVVEDECELFQEEWQNRDKHVFVLSKAGKPIYSRYGDENRLATLMGVMQALVFFVADSKDTIKTVIAGEHKVVFLIREHLILVCVSRTWESTSHLLLLLNYVYQQIVSVLTIGTLDKQFTRHRNLDLRRLLNGTERFLDGVINLMESEMGIVLGAVRCLPLAPSTRDAVVQSITQGVKLRSKQSKDEDLVFAILLADNQLVSIVRMKRHYPHPLDLHILINIVRSSESFRNAQSWSPICLPKFDSSGFLYAYISYLDDRSCLILLTVGNSEFYTLHECRDRIVERMNRSGCLQSISEACVASGYTVTSTGISELRHFVYKSKATAQYTSPRVSVPYSLVVGEERRIMEHYYRLHQLIHKQSRPMKLVYQCAATEIFLGWNTDNFEMYATFSPLTTKPTAISAVNKLMKWVQSEKERLFILTSPTF